MPFPLLPGNAEQTHATLRRGHKGLPWTEDALIALLAPGSKPMDTYLAVLGLRDCGTSRCVPALKALATHPKQDVKATAIQTIAHVAGANETPCFAERLSDPAYRAKVYALWAIGEHGDARAHDAVLAYVRRRRKVLSKASFDPREQMEFVASLHRTVGVRATQALLDDEFVWLRDSLCASLAKNPSISGERYRARVPGLVLG